MDSIKERKNSGFRVAVLTLSDSGFAGTREDVSGPLIGEMMTQSGYQVVLAEILPDQQSLIEEKMRAICDDGIADLILTTGGTGLSPTDCTPEATLAVVDRIVPGIPEGMRELSRKITPRGMLSRGVAGTRKGTLIVNLPGSPKAITETLPYLLSSLEHGLETLTGRASNCARPM